MNTSGIDRALKTDAYSSRYLVAVCPRDTFVRIINEGQTGLFVFNTHDSEQPGEHWIAVKLGDTSSDFFDSYGRHPEVCDDVARALRARGTLRWNTHKSPGDFVQRLRRLLSYVLSPIGQGLEYE